MAKVHSPDTEGSRLEELSEETYPILKAAEDVRTRVLFDTRIRNGFDYEALLGIWQETDSMSIRERDLGFWKLLRKSTQKITRYEVGRNENPMLANLEIEEYFRPFCLKNDEARWIARLPESHLERLCCPLCWSFQTAVPVEELTESLNFLTGSDMPPLIDSPEYLGDKCLKAFSEMYWLAVKDIADQNPKLLRPICGVPKGFENAVREMTREEILIFAARIPQRFRIRSTLKLWMMMRNVFDGIFGATQEEIGFLKIYRDVYAIQHAVEFGGIPATDASEIRKSLIRRYGNVTLGGVSIEDLEEQEALRRQIEAFTDENKEPTKFELADPQKTDIFKIMLLCGLTLTQAKIETRVKRSVIKYTLNDYRKLGIEVNESPTAFVNWRSADEREQIDIAIWRTVFLSIYEAMEGSSARTEVNVESVINAAAWVVSRRIRQNLGLPKGIYAAECWILARKLREHKIKKIFCGACGLHFYRITPERTGLVDWNEDTGEVLPLYSEAEVIDPCPFCALARYEGVGRLFHAITGNPLGDLRAKVGQDR